MEQRASALPSGPDTVAELRELYRAAEARAGRLRLLIGVERDLAAATVDTLDAVLANKSREIALFMGCRDGRVALGPDADGIALTAPGTTRRKVGALVLAGVDGAHEIADSEDRDALAMVAQQLGEAIDRVARETEREALVATLRERERRLEYLVGRIFFAQEEERRRVSRELHDGVAQMATALFRQLEAGDDPAVASIARDLVRELREVIGGLRPTTLDDLGLRAAVSTLVGQLETMGYAVTFEASGPERWPPVLETGFFRVAQEALTNVRKHAHGPCAIVVRLSADAALSRFELEVRDSGRGPPPLDTSDAARPSGEHVGIEMMRERMAALGGTLTTGTSPEGGFRVCASVETPAR